MNPLLSVFEPELLRLVLCGGDGLAEAYGPLIPAQAPEPTFTIHHYESGIVCAFHPDRHVLVPTEMPSSWRLPLDRWTPRLNQVTAHLLGYRNIIAADLMVETTASNTFFKLYVFECVNARPDEHIWETLDGIYCYQDDDKPNLPELAALWHAKPHKLHPVVMLLLSVWAATKGLPTP